jgi:EAL domain-containing protein (putative c-di-GMP-specific phosphodiesterase class I)/GGDEF domain-containing protein
MYLAIIVVALLATVFDIVSSIAIDHPSLYSVAFRDTFNYLFLLTHNATPFMVFGYIWILGKQDLKKNKWLFSLFSLPYLLIIVILVLNNSLRWCFYYDENGVYTHGVMMTPLYVAAYIYIVLSLVLIILHWKTIASEKRTAGLIFIVMSLASVIFQMNNPKLLVELFIESLTLLGFLLTIEDSSDLTNASLGIYNRHGFKTDTRALFAAKANFAVLSVKFKDFSFLTKTLGVMTTDQINKDIASHLDKLLKNHRAYHIGNNDYALLFCDTDLELVPKVIKEVQEIAQAEYNYHNVTLKFNPELTLIRVPEDVRTLEDLLVVSDAPYHVPSSPSSLTPVKLMDYERRIAVETAIDQGLKEHSFSLAFQPIWHKEGRKYATGEALCRLEDKTLGKISPDEFIPIAENTGAIIDIGAFVLNETCRFYKDNHLQEQGVKFIEVNLSVVQCMHKGMAKELYDIVKKNGLTTDNICFEITESAAINSMEMMDHTIQELKAYGFRFALDDYGTGYSNFSYLLHMPFSIIKLDKSLLWSAKDNQVAKVALESTIHMMKQMGLVALCEGAETKEQVELLEKYGIDEIQGHYFSKALSPEDYLKLIAKENGLKEKEEK